MIITWLATSLESVSVMARTRGLRVPCKHGGKMAKMWILFRSIDSWARSLGGPWTGWICSAPVQMSGCCLGAALSWLCDGLLQGWLFFIDLSFLREQPPWSFSGLGFLRARLLRLCCTAAFPPIFLQLRKGPLWSCAELLQSYALCSSDQCRS